MLTANNITYSVGGKRLLDNVSFKLETGKLNFVIGPNGAGKSTLIRIISNQLRPVGDGAVFYGKLNIRTTPILEMAKIRSVLSQNIEIAFPITVAEVVMMGRYPHFTGKPGKKDQIACEEAMNLFDIADFSGRNYLTLSGGERQRVHFARVLAQIWYPPETGCRYLILDEPLTFLDIHYQFDFLHKLIDFMKNNEMVVVGVVHDLNLAATFGDKILLLDHGKLIVEGRKEEVLTIGNISMVYKMEPKIHHENGRMYLFFD
ncbi:MAG: ATP-binding cassette domain-containing protein [Bacteroidota bacterium]